MSQPVADVSQPGEDGWRPISCALQIDEENEENEEIEEQDDIGQLQQSPASHGDSLSTLSQTQATHNSNPRAGVGVCEKAHMDSGNDRPLLFAMAFGVTVRARKIADWTEAPYEGLAKTQKPKLPML